jgi:hypothetical protein
MKTTVNEYRAKAYECLSLAECMNDPEERAELCGSIWPNRQKELNGVYEVPRGR